MSRLRRGLATMAVCALGAAAAIALPLPASADAPGIRINEVESNGGTPGDWVELFNPTDTAVDVSGYLFKDNDDTRTFAIPGGTTIAPGGYLVLDEKSGFGNFDFGLGAADAARLFTPSGDLVDLRTWTSHAPTTFGVRDGATPDWQETSAPTKGAANTFATVDPDPDPQPEPTDIRLNEIDSQPADWVELYNPAATAFDLSGYELRDNADDHRWLFPAGTSVAAGGYLVVTEASVGQGGGTFTAAIGIGGADRIRLFSPSGTLVDDTLPWTSHAALDGDATAATLARCPDGQGGFRLAHPTQGAANDCVLPKVAINEIESNGDATDWAEIVNLEATPVDISGWTLMDNDPIGHATGVTPLPAGTVLAPGAFFAFAEKTHFTFGLGGSDTVTIRDAAGKTVAEHAYTAHAAGVWGRCPDGTGEFRDIGTSTKGAANACGTPIRINEVESDGGSPDDWIEIVNPTAAAVEASGLVLKDSDDANSYTLPAGTSIAANGYLVIERATLGFGLGGSDRVRLFAGGELVDETVWTAHAETTLGRCADASGAFRSTYAASKGAENICAAPPIAWPGAPATSVLDTAPTFLEDSSGLDTQLTSGGTFLWAVDNGTGTFWKLVVAADGSVTPASGWAEGKRARFQKDAANAAAAGPDAEGITVAGDGFLYLASERDNSNKAVNQNIVLKIDPNAPGPDVVSTQEWEITALLPAVGANLGIEAVEWVPDADLAGKLWDDRTAAPYVPATYPGHGDGLFFVAVEDTGHVYAFALGAGTPVLVSEIDPGLGGVMALDWDAQIDVLWAVCDDGCDGAGAQISLNGTAQPGIVGVSRPAGLPNVNNEGFATLPVALTGSTRPAWWFQDGVTSGALRLGSLPSTPAGPTGPGGPVDPTPTPSPTAPTLPSTGGLEPLPGTSLVPSNQGTLQAPGVVGAGSPVTISVGAQHAGEAVEVWLYSTPTRIATGTLDSGGRITVTIPASTPPGAHRIAVYATDGTLLGWASIRVTALAATGGTDAGGLALAGGLILVAGAAAVVLRRWLENGRVRALG